MPATSPPLSPPAAPPSPGPSYRVRVFESGRVAGSPFFLAAGEAARLGRRHGLLSRLLARLVPVRRVTVHLHAADMGVILATLDNPDARPAALDAWSTVTRAAL